jgi:pyrroloquinoline-quinone synthase
VFQVNETIFDRIEQARARYDVLQHPFYQRWSAGELTMDELARYAGQYRYATQAIATLSERAADQAPEKRRAELERHAVEENEHVGMWDQFVEATGGTVGAEPTAETTECVESWTADDGYLASLARLYAIESGQPQISRTKIEGLAAFYDMEGGPGVEYFEVHQTMDVAHADQAKRLIEEEMSPEQADTVVAAAEEAFKANWRLLDGVA